MSQVILEGEYRHILMPLSEQRIQSFLGYGTGSIARSCPRQPLPLLLSSLSDPGLFQDVVDTYFPSILSPISLGFSSYSLHTILVKLPIVVLFLSHWWEYDKLDNQSNITD